MTQTVNPFWELKTHAMSLMKSLGYKVYTNVPDRGNQFVLFDSLTNTDIPTKDRTLGQVVLTIQYYDFDDAEGQIYASMDNLRSMLNKYPNSGHFTWQVIGNSMNIISDNSANVPLKHGTQDITLEYL